jgi:hypothetical protein
MTQVLSPITDERGNVWYPVKHAIGGIVLDISPEGQRLWQEYADRQKSELSEMCERRIAKQRALLKQGRA